MRSHLSTRPTHPCTAIPGKNGPCPCPYVRIEIAARIHPRLPRLPPGPSRT